MVRLSAAIVVVLVFTASLTACAPTPLKTGSAESPLKTGQPRFESNPFGNFPLSPSPGLFVLASDSPMADFRDQITVEARRGTRQVRSPFVLAVFAGIRSTGGYTGEFRSVQLSGQTLRVEADFYGPEAGEMVTQVMTKPTLFLTTRLPAGKYRFKLRARIYARGQTEKLEDERTVIVQE